MSDNMIYKGYRGSLEYSKDDERLIGKILGIKDSVSYHGMSLGEVQGAFREAVDDYLAMCEAEGIRPKREYTGQISIRIKPSVHERISEIADATGSKLNSVIAEALSGYVDT
ncbi:MAG: type II toxin-antitoxin system HicB family antitoxin, partial [Clostridiales Family XIII bacterium]|nr:type II toxin-antitoxin system HicB family antitoxin [Clostridiales Family XIII bacterium]